uniref:PDZ domain-containing protein n=1 Tax=Leersia perrieri TaxID=77586 RepID=A0A0D9XIF6_9ORYZ
MPHLRLATDSDVLRNGDTAPRARFVTFVYKRFGKRFLQSERSDLEKDCVKAKEAVLSISKSIVCLASSIDGSPLFACTGIVVDHVGSQTWIVTTANLVRKPHNNYEVYEGADIKIEVILYNKKVIDGCLSLYNQQYNIAVVTIQPHMDLPMVPLNDILDYYSLLPRPVVAVCRDLESRALEMRGGEMIRKTSNLDCNELVICTCFITQDFGGGPVMDLDIGIIGIALFDDEDATPVLPIEIIFEVLPENCGGIEAGDIISELDGVTLSSVAQFTAILLDKVEIASNLQKTVILKMDTAVKAALLVSSSTIGTQGRWNRTKYDYNCMI